MKAKDNPDLKELSKEEFLTCTRCGTVQIYHTHIVYSTGDRVCIDCKKESEESDRKKYDRWHR